MTTAALAAHLLRRPEIPQGTMDDSIDWTEAPPPILDNEHKAKLKRERGRESRKRAQAKASAKRKAKSGGKRNTGWHKQSRRDWKSKQE